MRLEYSWNVSTRMQECISIAAGINSDIFGTKRTQLECFSNVVEIFTIAARMRLKYSWNVPTRMQECISNARSECNSDIAVLKEPNKNALRMLLKSLEDAARMPLECISIAVGIYFDIFGCSSNAARMQLERPD